MARERRTLTAGMVFLGLVLLVRQDAQAQVHFTVVGPGSTPGGDMLRGEGIAAAGAGEFIRNNAVAESIHVDSWIKLERYMALSRFEQMQRFHTLLKNRRENNNLSLAQIAKRLRENPTESDLMNGDALNVLLEDLTDPKVSPSALMRTRVPLSVSLVHEVPFQYPTMGGTISMRVLTVRDGWPLALRNETFARERRAYLRAVDRVLEEIVQDKLMPQTVSALQEAVYELRTKVDFTLSQSDLAAYLEAKNFIKVLGEPGRLLQSQKIERMIAKLEQYPGTTVAELLEFMVENNVQFSPAAWPTERELYRQLYPLLRRQKENMAGAPPDNGQPIDPERKSDVEIAPRPLSNGQPQENPAEPRIGERSPAGFPRP